MHLCEMPYQIHTAPGGASPEYDVEQFCIYNMQIMNMMARDPEQVKRAKIDRRL